MTDRPLDISTGRPRAITDQEAYAEIATEHGDNWRDREGEHISITVVRDGLTAFSRVWMRGEVIQITIGSDDWISTVDPTTGKSWVDNDFKQQIATHGRVMFLPTEQLASIRAEHPEVDPDPYEDDRPFRPHRPGQDPSAGIRDAWAEQDRQARQPLRQMSVETITPKPKRPT